MLQLRILLNESNQCGSGKGRPIQIERDQLTQRQKGYGINVLAL